jgi:hypothetical protein
METAPRRLDGELRLRRFRLSKTIGGTAAQFRYDGLNPVQEPDGSNGVIANLLTGLRIDEYFTRADSGGNVSTFIADALGSTVGLVGSAGSIATSYTYQPFGATTVGDPKQQSVPVHQPRETMAENCTSIAHATKIPPSSDSSRRTRSASLPAIRTCAVTCATVRLQIPIGPV